MTIKRYKNSIMDFCKATNNIFVIADCIPCIETPIMAIIYIKYLFTQIAIHKLSHVPVYITYTMSGQWEEILLVLNHAVLLTRRDVENCPWRHLCVALSSIIICFVLYFFPRYDKKLTCCVFDPSILHPTVSHPELARNTFTFIYRNM